MNGNFLIFFSLLSFPDSILIFNLLNPSFLHGTIGTLQSFSTTLKKHAEENYLRYETSPIAAVIIVFKSIFLITKQRIKSREITIKNLQRIISKLTGGKNGKPRRGILREKLHLDFYFVYRKHGIETKINEYVICRQEVC